MADTERNRLSDGENRIDVAADAHADLLRLVSEKPGSKARIVIAGYG